MDYLWLMVMGLVMFLVGVGVGFVVGYVARDRKRR
jgi:hypothetical protein